MGATNPVYLFADSEPLFWIDRSVLFLKTLLQFVSDPNPSASYIGASNNDRPEFYEIFVAAMEKIGITEKRMIRADFAREDQQFLERSSIVLLAGGDAVQGWEVITKSGLSEAILQRHAKGAVLIGISAGAMQLGLGILSDGEEAQRRWTDTFQIVPFVIGVREEVSDWGNLRCAVRTVAGRSPGGIGIPARGGIVYHPDHSLEPLRLPVTAFRLEGGELFSSLLLPGAAVSNSFSLH